MRTALGLALAASLAACATAQSEAPVTPVGDEPPIVVPAPPRPPRPAPPPQRPWIAETLLLAEWGRAENRAVCAPLALTSDADGGGTARRAEFAGGWAVAFDQPGLRSAYGVAGVGSLDEDRLPQEQRVAAIEAQWPYFRRYGPGENLPAGSAAGYGLEGAEPYTSANPSGRGENSLAYLRIPGQGCMYNVWSRLGRDHLEALLGNLHIVTP